MRVKLKVYVATVGNTDSDWVIGVYGTHDEAEAAISAYPHYYCDHGITDYDVEVPLVPVVESCKPLGFEPDDYPFR